MAVGRNTRSPQYSSRQAASNPLREPQSATHVTPPVMAKGRLDAPYVRAKGPTGDLRLEPKVVRPLGACVVHHRHI